MYKSDEWYGLSCRVFFDGKFFKVGMGFEDGIVCVFYVYVKFGIVFCK